MNVAISIIALQGLVSKYTCERKQLCCYLPVACNDNFFLSSSVSSIGVLDTA